MSSERIPPFAASGPLSPQAKDLLARFDNMWHQKQRPALDDFLAGVPEGERLAVLIELVHSDLEFRLKAGELARVEDYLARYPHLAGQPAMVADLLAAEFHLRSRCDPYHTADYLVRFPEHAGLIECFTQEHHAGQETVAHPGDPAPATGRPRAATGGLAPPGYEILGELGHGGMGIVYRARQVRLNRIVALKVIRTGPEATPEDLARFRTEGEAVARLQHPHIVQIYDSGEHDGRPYFALEFVDGGSLAGRLKGRPLPPRQGARLVQTLAGAVHHAHQQKVLHRDLKPANVLLAADGTPKVTDFGLARWLDEVGQTRSGLVVGSLPYLAPEQANGQISQLGPATDVFGLGAILYECLTGRPPYCGSGNMELLKQASRGQVVPPRQLNRQVPRGLERICLKALAAEPAQRYGSAAELERALDRYLQRRRLGMLAALAAAVLLLVTGLLAGGRWLVPVGKPGFRGALDILVTEPGNPRRDRLRLYEPRARPLRPDDEIRIEVDLNRPGYCYVLWFDAQGQVIPIYPWVDFDWSKRPVQERPVAELRLPEGNYRYPIVVSPPGLETLLLLVRDTPLPVGVDLRGLLGEPKAQAYANLHYMAWFRNGLEVMDEDKRKPGEPRRHSNPAVRLQDHIQARLGSQFAYSRAVVFGNWGTRPGAGLAQLLGQVVGGRGKAPAGGPLGVVAPILVGVKVAEADVAMGQPEN